MAIKLEFDSAKNVKSPTIVLAKRSGKKLGIIQAHNIRFTDNLNSYNSLDFKVSKNYDNIVTQLWDEIVNFKLIWCKEWDAWFEITVEIDESNDLIKNVNARSIGEAELSVIKLFDIQINTEDDIELDDYVPTKLYDGQNKRASLLDRIIEKAPHYVIKHVDPTIANIQRVFTFDSTSIYDAFKDIEEEIGCLFILSQSSDENGNPERGIYVYDLQSNCNECGYRGEFNSTCSECGSHDITYGYGEDTTVFISSENLASNIKLTTDTGQVNTCFKLETGDDLMTASVRMCNPNGSEYLWFIPDNIKEDMSEELSETLDNYNELYSYYQNEYPVTIDADLLSDYNDLVEKYQEHDETIETITTGDGFKSLISILYNSIDFQQYLTSSMLPTIEITGTTAEEQAELLTAESLSPLSVANIDTISENTVNLNVLSMAKAIVRATYQVKIKESSFDSETKVWAGILTVTNYSDEEDTFDSEEITLVIDDDYANYVRQKIDKVLDKDKSEEYDITALFDKECVDEGAGVYSGDFVEELTYYALNQLNNFHESCQSCLDVLVEQGISDNEIWLDAETNLYETFYEDFYNKLNAIEAEIALRESEIEIVKKVYWDAAEIRTFIQDALDFEKYIGEDLWKEFCAYRRESLYSNKNYISDGLTNAELLDRANEFLNTANKELIKSATLQHSISAALNNLLVIKGFEPILDHFAVGNWIRVRIDGEIYKLRLIEYEVDFDDLEDLFVEFSDVIRCGNDISDLQSVLNQAETMATSYSTVERQASKSEETTQTVKSWFSDGLDATLTKIVNNADGQDMTFDRHGLLLRKKDDVSETYDNEQMKFINTTLAMTDDNWKTTKTAIGKFNYINPSTEEMETAFGVNGETIVGKMIIGETLSLYNSSGSLTFDSDGFKVTNGVNTFKVDPNSTSIITISKGLSNILNLDSNGNLVITGTVNARSGYFGVTNPFSISDNGFDGSYSDSIVVANYKNWIACELLYPTAVQGQYHNSQTITIQQYDPNDDEDNIIIILKSISLSLQYTYLAEDDGSGVIDDIIDEDLIIEEETGEEELVGNSGEGEGEGGETPSTPMITKRGELNVTILSSETNVTSNVVVIHVGDTTYYSYTHTFSNSMETYIKSLIRTNDANLDNSYPLADITVTNVYTCIKYKSAFTTYRLYTHIGTDYFRYSDDLVIQGGKVNMNDVTINDLYVKHNIDIDSGNYIGCAFNDANSGKWRITGMMDGEEGYLELSTTRKNNGLKNHPIRVTQYSDNFNSIVNTLTLLDENGKTIIPESLVATHIESDDGFVNFDSQVIFNQRNTWVGSSSASIERRLRFSSLNSNGTYLHDMFIYGGNANSTSAFGIYNARTSKSILYYNDTTDTVSVANAAHFYFKDWSGENRKPVASGSTDGKRMAMIGSNSSGLILYGQWEDSNSSYSIKYLTVPSSDIRLKENVKDTEIESAIDVLNKIKLHSFDWKQKQLAHQKIGFIADELESIDTRLSTGGGYNKDGTMNVKGVDTFYMLGYVVKAIQELYGMIKEEKR